jgi:UDP-N-acetylmuramoyl-L-alanyl-D-glutamate--2,6-diaminopimelate ligase
MTSADEIRSLKRTIALGMKLDEWRGWQLSKGLTTLRAKAACALMGHPARALKIVGVTGTDGKTTTTELTAAVLAASGRRVSWINTIGASIAGLRLEPTWGLTTPGPFVIQGLLYWMKRCAFEWVILEASSHGLAQRRFGGIMFQIGVVTNLTPEHLDYHRDMERYMAAKAVLIANTVGRGAARGIVVLNRDDPSYPRFAGLATGLQLSYGLSAAADVKASNIHLAEDHSTFDVATPAEQFPAALALPGLFNVYNALAAIAVGHSQGLFPTSMAEGLRSVTGVSGRMTAVFEGQPYSAVIDYAHTPRALEEVLRFYQGRVKGRIILVFGCEGEQNQGNRQPMGEIAGRLAGRVVVTRDDNRSQSIHAINEAIAGGLQRAGRREGLDYVILPDRRQAIEYACDMAEPGDLVLITGKGHEQSLNIDGREVPWDDEAVAREAIRKNMRLHPEGLP